MAYARPDVYVTESLRSGLRRPASSIQAVGGFIGESWKGPEIPTWCASWQEFVTYFGGFRAGEALSYLPYAVHSYFVAGGSGCYVARVTDGTADTSTKVLDDRAGTPLDTLGVTAKSPGDFANNIRIGIVDRDAPSGRFDLIVYDGTAVDANIVERWIDVTMDPAESRYVESVINSETRGSKHITVDDLSSVTAAPNDTPAAGNFQLAVGTDGGSVDDADYVAAIDSFDAVQVPFLLNIPGKTSSTIVNAAVQYAEGRSDAFVLIDSVSLADAATAVTTASGYTPNSSYGAIYWPWVKVQDAAISRAGVYKAIPPGGAVMGLYQLSDRDRGPQKTPAGMNSRLGGVVGLQIEPTLGDLDDLNVGHVNAIRLYPNQGPTVMGGRTLKLSGADRYVAVRRSLIYIRSALTDLLRGTLFEPNDQILWENVNSSINKFLLDYWRARGLKGETPGEAFFTKCDSENNDEAAIEAGELHIDVGVALQYPAEFIILRIGQFENGSVTTVQEA